MKPKVRPLERSRQAAGKLHLLLITSTILSKNKKSKMTTRAIASKLKRLFPGKPDRGMVAWRLRLGIALLLVAASGGTLLL
jgi:hypothetical protein